MTWPEFSSLYLLVTLAGLLLCRSRWRGRGLPLFRTAAGLTLALCICDAVAESRRIWHFPYLLGISFLEVPLENVAITLATVLNSLIYYLLLAERPG